jgi:adenylyltransferase/sulfurtransferase
MNQSELARYDRHLRIKEFGIAGQEKLKASKVLVIGAGGLGSPLLLYLAAAGVGTLGIIDFDAVELSNLQRQVLFTEADVGKNKAETAKEKVFALNPHIQVNVYPIKLTSQNALEIIQEYDVVADGSDNFPTRYLVNDACVLLDKPLVYASIHRFEGQASVFNHRDKLGDLGPNYRDLFPIPPLPDSVPSCAEAGVLGVLPGMLGTIQANEVLKIITDIGQTLSGRLFVLDAASFETRTFNVRRNPQNPLNGVYPSITSLIDYEEFCGIKPVALIKENTIKSLTMSELNAMLEEKKDFQLIDVREPYEHEAYNIGGELMPLGEIEQHLDNISREKIVIIHCQSGMRSLKAIQLLEDNHGFTNLYNLGGGI